MSTLLMPFVDSSESFTNGFECGQIWQRVSEGESFDKLLIHLANKKQIIMICESFGVYCKIELSTDSEWLYLTVKSVLS